jgi:hypothetical protein
VRRGAARRCAHLVRYELLEHHGRLERRAIIDGVQHVLTKVCSLRRRDVEIGSETRRGRSLQRARRHVRQRLEQRAGELAGGKGIGGVRR